MRNFFAGLMVFALAMHFSSFIPVYAGEADDEEEIARKEKEARDKAIKEGKIPKNPAVVDNKKPPVKTPEKAPDKATSSAVIPGKTPAAAKVGPLDNLCKTCLGTGTLAVNPYKPFVRLMASGEAFDPEALHVRTLCPTCKKYSSDAQIVAEFKTTVEKSQHWPQNAAHHNGTEQMPLMSTPYVSLTSKLSPEEMTSVGEKLERLAGILQTNAKSTVLLASQPHRAHISLLDDEQYGGMIEKLTKDKNTQDHYKKKMMFEVNYNSKEEGGLEMYVMHLKPEAVPPDSAAVFAFGKHLISAATKDKAPLWLQEGFAAYCENVTLGTNNVYTYDTSEATSPKLAKNWNMEVKNYANKNRLVSWERLFKIDPKKEKIQAQEYLNFYALVSCLIKVDPVRFDKMVLMIRQGENGTSAIEKAYGRNITQMQNLWGQWALVQK